MDNMKFNIIGEDGKEIPCEIISLLPNEEDPTSPYIIYTDFKTDRGYKLLCGQLIEENDSYTINKIEDDNIIEQLKDTLTDDMLKIIEDNEGAF